MRTKANRRGGFTLLEMILAASLAFFLLAALYQAIALHDLYRVTAEAELREAQTARALLRRIADEIRTLTAPVEDEFATRADFARRLLELGVKATRRDRAGTTSVTDRLERFAAPSELPEKFRLIGTENSLVLLVRTQATGLSDVERFAAEETADASADRSTDDRVPVSEVRQVLYLPKPIAEFEEERSLEGSMDDPDVEPDRQEGLAEVDLEVDGFELEPIHRGVIRQEIAVPQSVEALFEARIRLEELLGALSGKGIAGESIDRDLIDDGGELGGDQLSFSQEFGARDPFVVTEILTEDVTALRFRYHDGTAWRGRWDEGLRLPVAVEISLSFDPRASDPEFVGDYLETLAEEALVSADTFAADPLAGDEPEPPLFPYRLVVAVPTSDPANRARGAGSLDDGLGSSIGASPYDSAPMGSRR